jgi:TctA family transporter
MKAATVAGLAGSGKEIRANVLNSSLAGAFQRWHPGFGVAEEAKLAA